jgi:RecA-family ATPase
MLLTGVTGAGKSGMALHIAACLASKTPLLNLVHRHKGPEYGEPVFPVTEPSTVLYIDYELPHSIRAEKRLIPLSKSFEKKFGHRLYFAPYLSRYRLHNMRGEEAGKGSFDKLARLVKATRPDVLVIDPLSSSHTVDENTIALKQPLNNVDRLIDEYGCAVLIVHHASVKSERDRSGRKVEKDTAQQPRGHSSLLDWTDVHVHLNELPVAGSAKEREGEDHRFLELAFGKTRYALHTTKNRALLEGLDSSPETRLPELR